MKYTATLTALILTLSGVQAFAQDVTAGEKIFKKCKACHQIGEGAKHATGPILTGVIGRTAGTAEGYKYSKPMTAAGEAGHVWDEDSIFEYIENPTKYLRALLDDPRAKAKMRFKLKSKQDRRDVIAYVASFRQPMEEAAKESGSMEMAAAPMETPGKLCVTNGAHVEHVFVVETSDTRTLEALAPGGTLCTDTDQGGKVSVYETIDSLEGCTRIVPANQSDTMIKYEEFDRCSWASNTN